MNEPNEAVEALALADVLLRQRDEAERAMVAAAKKSKTADVPLHLADIEAAYAGVWPALDRAARVLTDEQRCPPAFMVHRASIDERARTRGTSPAPGTALGATLEREGVRVAKLALAAMQEAVPGVDWAARAQASPAASVKVGRGSMRTPVLVASAVAVMAAIAIAVVVTREPPPRKRPEVIEPVIDVTPLVRADTHVVVAWLAENDRRHPEQTRLLRERITAELSAQIATTTDDDVLARAIERASHLGLDASVVDAAHARRAALVTAELPTMGLATMHYRLTGTGAHALAPALRAQVLAAYDAALVAALEANEPVDELVAYVRDSVHSLDEVPRAAAALAAHLRAVFARELPLARTADALRELAGRGRFVLSEDELAETFEPRAAQLAAAARDVSELGDWIISGLLDDAAVARAETRAVALARRSDAAARAFVYHGGFDHLDAWNEIDALLTRQCEAKAKRARVAAPVLRDVVAQACLGPDDQVFFDAYGGAAEGRAAAAAVTAALAPARAIQAVELVRSGPGDDAALRFELEPGAVAADGATFACTVTIEILATGVTGTIEGRCPADPGAGVP